GDVFDLWGTGHELPTRVEFFGDEIESLRTFAPETMLSVRELNSVIISPKSDILVSQTLANEVIAKLNSTRKKAGKRTAEIIDSVVSRLEINPSDPSLVWALPFIKRECATLLDYLPQDAVIVFDEPKAIDDKAKLQRNAHVTRVKSFMEAGEALEYHKDSLMTRDELYAHFATRICLVFNK
ncbi:MAG: hypothetical protein IKB56_01490, partial [Clostridia bacterium]|nr:hypothetical protein [Clostridia bacterium]